MASIINASTSGAGGVITTADASGVLQLQTAGTTALSISAAQAVTLANALPAASGGTGLTAPGTSGNVLTSNGTAWTSAAPATSVTSLNGQTGAITNTDYGAIGSYVTAGSSSISFSSEPSFGATVAGSSLVYSSTNDTNGSPLGARSAAGIGILTANQKTASLSGTWRLMTRIYQGSSTYTIGLWVRIS
jgi:hypothetical protein